VATKDLSGIDDAVSSCVGDKRVWHCECQGSVRFLSLPTSLASLEEELVRKPAGLILVDSIASLVRKEYDTGSSIERTDYLAGEASRLKWVVHSKDLIDAL
jgi:hypothetical protein